MATAKKKKNDKSTTALKVPLSALLESWQVLNKHIKDLNEKECEELLAQEKAGKKRMGFLLRLYGRYNTLRTIRERSELAGAVQI